MEFNLTDTVALLSRTPGALNALLRGLPEAWTRSGEGEDTWSAADVVAHLIHADREDWIPRARLILEAGERLPFPPFDRWGNIRESRNCPLDDVLDDFARGRAARLRDLDAMQLKPSDLERRGQHPALGSATLSQLLATWAAHDLNHIHQIARVMASQYREAVGPWSKFLGVMHCNGHGA